MELMTMKMSSIVFALLFLATGILYAQRWEVGGSAGYGMSPDVKVTRGDATGTTGFKSGVVFGAVLGSDFQRFIGGEVRYTFIQNDLQVASGSTKATASGQSHSLHYDILVHGTTKGESVRPFLACGAGVTYVRGTGAEPAFQPLSNLLVLTHTSQALPLISAGGGVKIPLSRRSLIRIDVRDYISPFPDKVLATPPSSTTGGWIHHFVAQLGVSAVF
jgi:hypothetical protein